MKRFKQMLAVLLCAVALCGLAPAALAAQPLDEGENGGKVIIYFETCGGTGIPVVERTSGDGKLYSLPPPWRATPSRAGTPTSWAVMRS